MTTMIESKTGAPSPLQPGELVGQPGDGVALAAAGGVLDQVAGAHAASGRVGQQAAHHVELVVARPDLGAPLPARLLVFLLHHLGEVFEDVGEAFPAQHLPPQVVGLDPAGVGRIAGAVVPAAVEGQEPGGLAAEAGAEPDLGFVQGEVGDAAAELEQLLARVAVALVLLHRVGHRLLGEVVLELEGDHRQAVDEQPDVQRPLGLVAAVAKLAGDREAVPPEALLRLGVVGRGGAVEKVEVVGAVADAVAQHVDGAALADLTLKPGQEAAARGTGLGQIERLRRFGLGRAQEGGELGQVDAVFAVVVVEVAAAPSGPGVGSGRLAHGGTRRRVAGMAGQRRADEALEAAFGDVGCGHAASLRIYTGYGPGNSFALAAASVHVVIFCNTAPLMSSQKSTIRQRSKSKPALLETLSQPVRETASATKNIRIGVRAGGESNQLLQKTSG